jgi:hypothetical protein
MSFFWVGFEKQAGEANSIHWGLSKFAGFKQGITSGLFSKDGLKQTVKSNPLPTSLMKTMPPARVSGRGVGSMAIP